MYKLKLPNSTELKSAKGGKKYACEVVKFPEREGNDLVEVLFPVAEEIRDKVSIRYCSLIW